jgi:hypothetical protein
MNDNTALVAHWLASGRSAAAVAPAMRLATAPQVHRAVSKARQIRDLLGEIDLEGAQQTVQRLSNDRAFRQAVATAAGRVESAMNARRSHRRTILMALAAGVIAATAAGYLRRSSQAAPKAPKVAQYAEEVESDVAGHAHP